jgi:predicted enzyme related to lactoylglutathione lyase
LGQCCTSRNVNSHFGSDFGEFHKEVGMIAAVMIHVSDVQAALDWYQRAFPMAARKTVGGFDFLVVDDIQIEIVPADEKVSSGPAGTVVYWRVKDFDRALAHMQSVGSVLYRGPLEIENDLRMCQVRDPWGNCIGLRGPYPISHLFDH